MTNYMISYSSAQKALATRIDETLTTKDNSCIIYHRDFDGDFVQEIANAITESDFVIALISSDYVKSNWCVKEFQLAHKANKVIPVLVEYCDYSNLPTFDSYIDVTDDNIDTAAIRIKSEIAKSIKHLRPLLLSKVEIFNFIEQVRIVIPLLSGEFDSQSWQNLVVQNLELAFTKGEFSQVIKLDEVVETKEEAEKIRIQYNSDIVMYGGFKDGVVEFCFQSNGWSFEENYELGRKIPVDNIIFKEKPDNIRVIHMALLLTYGNYEFCRGRSDKASRYFYEAIPEMDKKTKQNNLYMLYFYLFNGSSAFELGRYEEAIRLYTLAIEIDSTSVNAWNNRGLSWHNIGKHNEALSDFNVAIQLDPQNALLWNNRSRSLNSLGKHSEALNDIKRAISLKHDISYFWANFAEIQEGQGNIIGALENLTKAIVLAPYQANFRLKRAYDLMQLGEYEMALHDYKYVTFFEPDNKIAWQSIARIQLDMEEYELSLSTSLIALELDPNDSETWGNYGNALTGIERYSEALEAYSKSLAINPENQKTLYNQSYSQLELGFIEEAKQSLRKALELNPDCSLCYFSLGEILFEEQQFPKAIPYLLKATELNPTKGLWWSTLGIALSEVGNYSESKLALEKATEIDSHLVQVWINLSNVLFILKEYEQSEISYTKAIELDENNSTSWYSRGYSRMHMADKLTGDARKKLLELALSDLNQSILIKASEPSVWFVRGVLHGINERWCKALSDFQECIRLGLDTEEVRIAIFTSKTKCKR